MNTAEPDWKPWFSPHKRIVQVPLDEVKQRLIEVFKRWGKPGAMRVDNGEPFGDPTAHATPALALWLIAMDVDMIWNKPHCPQQNGRVEKMQDTTARWAEVQQARNAAVLQQNLEQALCVQRGLYPVLRLSGQTREAAFPALHTSRRPYREEDFSIGRVYAFLCRRLYTRKVSGKGEIMQFGRLYNVGYCRRHQWVQLRLTANGKCWQVFVDYQLIKELPADNLSAEHVQNLTVFQRTKSKT
jgi:hypothetical protein